MSTTDFRIQRIKKNGNINIMILLYLIRFILKSVVLSHVGWAKSFSCPPYMTNRYYLLSRSHAPVLIFLSRLYILSLKAASSYDCGSGG